jgi:hypothetical protein
LVLFFKKEHSSRGDSDQPDNNLTVFAANTLEPDSILTVFAPRPKDFMRLSQNHARLNRVFGPFCARRHGKF